MFLDRLSYIVAVDLNVILQFIFELIGKETYASANLQITVLIAKNKVQSTVN